MSEMLLKRQSIKHVTVQWWLRNVKVTPTFESNVFFHAVCVCMHVLRRYSSSNNEYFLKQHQPVDLSNGACVTVRCEMNLISINLCAGKVKDGCMLTANTLLVTLWRYACYYYYYCHHHHYCHHHIKYLKQSESLLPSTSLVIHFLFTLVVHNSMLFSDCCLHSTACSFLLSTVISSHVHSYESEVP